MASKEVDLKIQELLEPDREQGKIGVKFNFPDSKVKSCSDGNRRAQGLLSINSWLKIREILEL